MKRCLELITDDSGKLSFSRVMIIVVVVVYLVYAGVVVIKKGELPDIPMGVVGLLTALYGFNKFSPTIPFTGGGQ
ncbi:MAG: hypothetical protein AB1553_02030 [Nitrospirota bacterium]